MDYITLFGYIILYGLCIILFVESLDFIILYYIASRGTS